MLLPKLGGSWLLPPRDFSHPRVTLWITTAFHLDTPDEKDLPPIQIADIFSGLPSLFLTTSGSVKLNHGYSE